MVVDDCLLNNALSLTVQNSDQRATPSSTDTTNHGLSNLPGISLARLFQQPVPAEPSTSPRGGQVHGPYVCFSPTGSAWTATPSGCGLKSFGRTTTVSGPTMLRRTIDPHADVRPIGRRLERCQVVGHLPRPRTRLRFIELVDQRLAFKDVACPDPDLLLVPS